MNMPLPLEGLRVLTAEQYGAGPFGSMQLADLGAEVIKIENPAEGGDVARGTAPHLLDDGTGRPDSLFFQSFNRNKKSLTLDLKSPAGQAVFRRLAARSDAVMNNLRGDQPAKLGLTYDALKDVNPKIVCAHLSAYGRDNERTNWPGYDYLMQAEAGYLYLTGEPDGPPARMGVSMVDFMTGMTTAMSLLASVLGARQHGQGRDVDVSLFDVAMAQLTYPAAWYLSAGDAIRRMPRSAHPTTVPCQLVRSADGWLFIMCMTPKFWRALADAIGQPELVQDPRFATPELRRENVEALSAILDAAFGAATTAQWMQRLGGKLPAAPVLHLAQALDNPYAQARGLVQEVPHPSGTLRTVASPIKLDGARPAAAACSPLGADTGDVLAASGFSAAEIESLREQNVI